MTRYLYSTLYRLAKALDVVWSILTRADTTAAGVHGNGFGRESLEMDERLEPLAMAALNDNEYTAHRLAGHDTSVGGTGEHPFSTTI